MPTYTIEEVYSTVRSSRTEKLYFMNMEQIGIMITRNGIREALMGGLTTEQYMVPRDEAVIIEITITRRGKSDSIV